MITPNDFRRVLRVFRCVRSEPSAYIVKGSRRTQRKTRRTRRQSYVVSLNHPDREIIRSGRWNSCQLEFCRRACLCWSNLLFTSALLNHLVIHAGILAIHLKEGNEFSINLIFK